MERQAKPNCSTGELALSKTDSFVGKRLTVLVMFVGMALVLAGAFPTFATAQEKTQQFLVPNSPDTGGVSTAATTAAACTDPTAICLPDSIYTFTLSDTSGVCSWNVTVDWGDRSSTETKKVPAGGSATFSHVYAAPSLANSTFYTVTRTAPAGTSSDPNTECLAFSDTVRVEVPPLTIEVTAPETVIDSHPPAVSGRSAKFTYHSPNYPPNPDPDALNVSFECSLDGDEFTICPDLYTGLSNGSHTFEVRAYFWYDPSSPQDPDAQPFKVYDHTPASYSWTVDAIKPKMSSSTPAPGQTSVKRNTNIAATFSEAMRRTTINKTTFKLFKVNLDGSKTQITNVTVALSANGLTATLNPFGTSSTLLAANTRYQAVVTKAAKDLVGNQLDQNPTATGNQQAVWTFTTGSS